MNYGSQKAKDIELANGSLADNSFAPKFAVKPKNEYRHDARGQARQLDKHARDYRIKTFNRNGKVVGTERFEK
jgi:hypothetical protein